jgi:hypothetical protein
MQKLCTQHKIYQTLPLHYKLNITICLINQHRGYTFDPHSKLFLFLGDMDNWIAHVYRTSSDDQSSHLSAVDLQDQGEQFLVINKINLTAKAHSQQQPRAWLLYPTLLR